MSHVIGGRNAGEDSAYIYWVSFTTISFSYLGSGFNVRRWSHKSDLRLVLVGLSVSGGGMGTSQSEKRLAKDLRRLRMVSAFTSSWLRLARGVGVSGMLKVLVRDWDLL